MADHERPHEIPTHLEIEDKLLFGLTLRQAVIALVGVALGFLIYSQLHRLPWEWTALGGAPGGHLPLWLQILCGALPVLLALALALISPAGRPLEDWLFALARYAAQPKRCVWRSRPTPAARSAGVGQEEKEDNEEIAEVN